MLSSQDLSTLYQIINDENQTFENIGDNFRKAFDKSNQFKAGTTLCFLLKDNLLNIQQRIISFYILYILKTGEKIETNPFLPIILEIIQTSKNKIEQNFLFDFLYNQIDYVKMQIKSYLQDNSKESKLNSQQIQIFWEKYYKELLNGNNINQNLNDHMRHVIFDRKKNDIKNIEHHPPIDFKAVKIEEELNLNYFQPNYMTYYPANDNNVLFNDEPIWLTPTLKHNYIWEKQEKK